MNNQLDDPESQFYPPISFSLHGDEDPYFLRCVRIISFHEESSTPPPLSLVFDIPNIALKK